MSYFFLLLSSCSFKIPFYLRQPVFNHYTYRNISCLSIFISLYSFILSTLVFMGFFFYILSSRVGRYRTEGIKVSLSVCPAPLLSLSPHVHVSLWPPCFATGFVAHDGLQTKRPARSVYYGLYSATPLLLTSNSLRVSVTNLEISVLE